MGEHDFGKDESKTRFCKTDNSAYTGINGIMDYWYPNHGLTLIWTCCSRYDYTIYFNQKNKKGKWCLEPVQKCMNKAKTKKCKKWKKQQKCNKKWVKKNCNKTCKVCN